MIPTCMYIYIYIYVCTYVVNTFVCICVYAVDWENFVVKKVT